MEVDKVANVEVDKVADMVAHMEVDMVADMKVDMVVVSRPTRWSLWCWFDRCIFELGNTNIQVGYQRIQEFHIRYNRQTTMVENNDHLL